ncbi:MAG: hypothetical protein ACI8PQ_002897, partial [Planctomycetota bacterium]
SASWGVHGTMVPMDRAKLQIVPAIEAHSLQPRSARTIRATPQNEINSRQNQSQC